jgi:hypothetical protein
VDAYDALGRVITVDAYVLHPGGLGVTAGLYRGQVRAIDPLRSYGVRVSREKGRSPKSFSSEHLIVISEEEWKARGRRGNERLKACCEELRREARDCVLEGDDPSPRA